MAQIAPIQPNLSPAPPGGSPAGGGEQSAFSPHLQDALAGRNASAGSDPMHTSASTQPNTAVRQDQATTPPNRFFGEILHEMQGEVNPLSIDDPASPQGWGVLFAGLKEVTASADFTGNWRRAAGSQGEFTPPAAASPLPTTATLAGAQQGGTDPVFPFTEFPQGQLPSQLRPVPGHSTERYAPLLAEQARAATDSTVPPAAPQQRDTLLAQLQQIIANSNETGRVAVSVSRQTPENVEANARTQFSQVITVSSGDTAPAGATLEKPPQQLDGLRQNVHQQYYDAKLGQLSDKGTEHKDQQPQGETGRQTPSANTAATTAALTSPSEAGTIFSPTLVAGQEPAPVMAVETSRAVPLPSPTQNHDNQVMQQIIERFQLTRRPLETHINIRLQPAELGALKIDLTVSEGSIRASVVAQNQQVQEIIERNLARLRSILENQGFTIDSLVVTSESEAVDEFNHANHQPFRQHRSSAPQTSTPESAAAAFSFEQVVAAGSAEKPGVNVKI